MQFKDLTPGKWYLVGLENEDGQIDWQHAPLYKFHGAGEWTDDSGEYAEEIYDPTLEMHVSLSSADDYLEQA